MLLIEIVSVIVMLVIILAGIEIAKLFPGVYVPRAEYAAWEEMFFSYMLASTFSIICLAVAYFHASQ